MKTLIKHTHKLLLSLLVVTGLGQVLMASNNKFTVLNWTMVCTTSTSEFFPLAWGPTKDMYSTGAFAEDLVANMLVSDVVACPGETITLSVIPNGGQAPYTITWYSDAGLSQVVGSGPSIEVYITNPVTYHVRITGANGISTIQQVVVDIDVPTFYIVPECDPTGQYYILHLFSSSDENVVTANLGQVVDLGIPSEWKIINIPLDSCILVQVASPSGCVVTEEHCAPDCNPPCDLSVALDDISICEEGQATLTAQITGGTAPYSFSWSNGATTSSIMVSPTVDSNFGVTVTDSRPTPCEANASATVAVIAFPQILEAEVACAQDSLTYSVTFTVTNATLSTAGGETFNGSGEFTVTGLNLMDAITITTSNECGDTTTTIAPPNCSIECDLSVMVASDTICPSESATLTAGISGGTAPFSYSWSPGGETTASITVSPAATTQYKITVLDSNPSQVCMVQDSALVTVLRLPNIAIDTTYCGPTDGTYTVVFTAAGATTVTANAVSLSPDATGVYSTNTAAGMPTTIIASNDCGEVTFTVDAPDCDTICDLTVMAFTDTTICRGASTALSAITSGGTAPFSYNWSPGGMTSSSITVMPNVTTQYTVQVADSLGCTAVDSAIVTVVNQPAILTNAIFCGPEVGSYTVTFSTQNANYLLINGIDFSVSPTITYTTTTDSLIFIEAGNLCDTVRLEVSGDFLECCDLRITLNDTISCTGEPIALTPSVLGGEPAYTFAWYDNANGNGTPLSTDSIYLATTTGTYYLFVDDQDPNCPPALDSSVVTITEIPTLIIDTTYCGPEIGLYTVEFSTQNETFVIVNGNNLPLTPPYSYTTTLDSTIKIEVGNSCDTLSAMVNSNLLNCCDLQVMLEDTVICNNVLPVLNPTVTGGTPAYTYAWYDNPEGSGTPLSTEATFLVPDEGTYYVFVDDQDPNCPAALDSSIVNRSSIPVFMLDTIFCGPEIGYYTVSFTAEYEISTIINGVEVPLMDVYTYTTTLDSSIQVNLQGPCGSLGTSVTPENLECCDVTVAVEDATICVDSTTTLTAVISGGTAPFSYSWSPGGETTESITVSPAMTTQYIVVVTDSVACQATDTATVNVISLPVIAIDTSYCGPADGTYTVVFTAAGATIITANGTPLTADATGVYTATTTAGEPTLIVASNDCGEVTFTVDAPDCDTICDLTVMAFTDTTICRGASTTLSAITSGGTAPFGYNWSPGGMTSSSITVTPNVTTQYTVQVSDSLGCTAVDSAIVTVVNQPAILTNAIFCGPEVGYYTVTFSAQNANYITINGNDFSVSPTITYTTTTDSLIFIEAGNLCDTVSLEVSGDFLECCDLRITLNDAISCTGEPIALTPSVLGGEPAYTFGWYDNTNGDGTPLSTDSIYLATTTGTYYLFVDDQDPNCPPALDSSIVTITEIPTLIIDTTYCGPEIGLYTVEFSTQNETFVIVNGNNLPLTPPYSYTTTLDSTIKIEVGNSCDTISEMVNSQFLGCCDLQVMLSDTTVCILDSIVTLVPIVTGGEPEYTYAWYNNSQGEGVPLASTMTLTVAESGTYYLFVDDQNPDCPAVVDSSVVDFALYAYYSIDTLVCGPASGYYTATFTVINHIEIIINGVEYPIMESYTVTATLDSLIRIDLYGNCNNSSIIILTNSLDCCTVRASVSDTTICAGETIVLEAMGSLGFPPYSYLWNTGETTSSITVSPTETTQYSVAISDSDTLNCTAFDTATVTVISLPVIAIDTSYCGPADGTYTVEFTAADATIVTANGTPLTADATGVYTATTTAGESTLIVASNDCGEITFTVEPPDCCDLTVSIGDTTVCLADSVVLTATLTGGTPDFTYLWSDGNTTSSITINPTATVSYSVTVTDANDCTAVDTATINVTLPPSLTMISKECAEDSLTYTVTFSTNISGAGITASAGVLVCNNGMCQITNIPLTGGITITATNICGTLSLPLDPPDCCNLSVTLSDSTLCIRDQMILAPMISNGIPPFTYNWSTGETTETILIFPSGTTTYSLTVTDARAIACMAADTTTIVVNPFPRITLDSVVCGEDNENAFVYVSTTNTDSFEVGSPGTIFASNPPNYTILVPNDSLVWVFATNDCGVDSLLLSSSCPACDLGVSVRDTTICLGDSAQLLVEILEGASAYTVEWFDNIDCQGEPLGVDTALVVGPTITTTYYVMVTDPMVDSCSVKLPVTVTIKPDPMIDIQSVVCLGDTLNYQVILTANNTNILLTSIGEIDDSQAPIYVLTIPKDSTVTIIAINECGSDTTVVNPPFCCDLMAIVSSDTTICNGGAISLEVTITGTGAYEIGWFDNEACDGDPLSTTTTLTVSPTVTTTYYVMVSDTTSDSCMVKLPVTVTVVDLPEIVVISATCGPETGQYTVVFTASGGTTVTANGVSLTPDANGVYTATAPEGTTMIILSSNACGEINREVPSPDCGCLVDIITENTAICVGDEITLVAQASTTEPDQVFKWFDNPECAGDSLGMGPELTVMPAVETTYYVMLTTADGLTCKDSITVTIAPVFISTGPVCQESSSTYFLEFITNPENVLVLASEGVLSNLGGGNYIVEDVSSNLSVTISVIDTVLGCMLDTIISSPVVCLEETDIQAFVNGQADNIATIHYGMTVQLDVAVPECDSCTYTYNWLGAPTISDPSAKNPTFSPEDSEPQVYVFTVEVNRDADCCVTVRDTVSVCVIPQLCDDAVFVPNAFSPNGDDLNDVFRIRVGDVEDVHLVIYNRWGEKIKELNSTKDTWDGTFQGKKLPSDVYGYYMTARCINGEEIFRKGNITLLK